MICCLKCYSNCLTSMSDSELQLQQLLVSLIANSADLCSFNTFKLMMGISPNKVGQTCQWQGRSFSFSPKFCLGLGRVFFIHHCTIIFVDFDLTASGDFTPASEEVCLAKGVCPICVLGLQELTVFWNICCAKSQHWGLAKPINNFTIYQHLGLGTMATWPSLLLLPRVGEVLQLV